MADDIEIIDASHDRKYYCQIPNMVDDIGLSVHAFRLYVHLKRVTGEDGECWQATKTLAENCRMSVHAVVNAKRELLDQKLIEIESKEKPSGGRPYHLVRITDIWPQNMARYAGDSQAAQVTVGNLQVTIGNNEVTGGNDQVTHMQRKNNPLKKKIAKNKAASKQAALLDTSEKSSDVSGKLPALPAATATINSLKSHQAIQAIKEITHYYPPRDLSIYQHIIEKIGDKPNKALIWRIHKLILLHGWSPSNWTNFLDRYEDGCQYICSNDRARLDAMQNPYEVPA